jgi:hypothetical protein
MTELILIICLIVSNVFMDISAEGRLTGWWDKETTWRNKWKLGKPENGPAFWGSTTVFVFITDGWHLMQFIFHTCWQLGIAIQYDNWIFSFILIKVIFSGGFELLYSYLKRQK